MKKITKIITIMLAFCVAFSGLPFMAGDLDAQAAAKLPTKITLKASANGQTATNLSWNKIRSPQKGYAVLRNGTPIKHFNTKTVSFKDSGLKAGTSYKYQIKTYKTKKVTQWYNKATKKWQTKKPAKKYRGSSKKVTVYTYSKASNAVTIKTAPIPTYTITWKDSDGKTLKTTSVKKGVKPSYGSTPSKNGYVFTGWSPSVVAANGNATYTAQFRNNLPAPTELYAEKGDNKILVSWKAVTGAAKYKVYCQYGSSTASLVVNGTSCTYNKALTEGTTYTFKVVALDSSNNASINVSSGYPFKYTTKTSTPTQPGGNDDIKVGGTKTVTDYLGITRTFIKEVENGSVYWRNSDNSNAFIIQDSNLLIYDKTIDGTFTKNSHAMIQYHGATFDLTKIQREFNPQNWSYGEFLHPVEMYNGDSSKFTIKLEDGVYIEPMNTYYCDRSNNGKVSATTRYYYIKNNRRVAMANPVGQFLTTETSGNITTKNIYLNTLSNVGNGLGIFTAELNYDVIYDGKVIATITTNTAYDGTFKNTAQPGNNMSAHRRAYLDIAKKAVGNGTSFASDMRAIEEYIESHYTYGQEVTAYGVTFNMTCAGGAAILETWAIYKYDKWGFDSQGSSAVDGHIVYHTNDDPTHYYQAQGSGDPNSYFDDNGNDDYHYTFG